MIENLRLIELFAGYGSQALALKYLGIPFEHHFVCEFDKYAIQSYNDIHGTNFEVSDIRNINADDLNIAETDKYKYLMTYSFPCTDLSIAGKRKGMKRGSDTASSLLWEVERLLKECDNLPQYLLMENVPQVIGKDNLKLFGDWTKFLTKLGYKNYYRLLNAKDYGVPQNRERCFMVSILTSENKTFCFPRKQKTNPKFLDMKLPVSEIDDKYYLSEKTINRIVLWKSHENPLYNIIHDDSVVSTLTARGAVELHSGMKIFSDYEIIDIGSSRKFWVDRRDCDIVPTLRTTNKFGVVDCIYVKNNTKRGYIECYENQILKISFPTSNSKRGRVQGDLCPTITTKNELAVFDNNHIFRVLTPKECFRLMGVNDEDYNKLTVSDSQKYKQAGNSIVVDVLMAIFKNLFITECKINRLF